MYVGLIVIAVLGIVFSQIVTEIERLIVPWRNAR
jgi:ABC-type nitrate/sulfonate/bicarbonate transport system permease component